MSISLILIIVLYVVPAIGVFLITLLNDHSDVKLWQLILISLCPVFNLILFVVLLSINLILPILILTLISSCAIEGEDCSNATYKLVVWENESKMIQISYESSVKGYKLYTGCSLLPNYPPEVFNLLDSNTTKNWAEWSIQRECTPEYIRVSNGQIEETIRI